MKIGIVDLDTSHPQNWIPILRELGHEIVGVWDGGSVHQPDYVQRFCDERHIPKVYNSIEALAKDCDGAILHGCDWDTHVAKAKPFVEAGKSVLIDKPVAGKPRDIAWLKNAASQGARISGGSSLRFCREVKAWHAKPALERGEVHTVFCGCSTDEFNYGIHAYSLLCGLMGPGIRTARHLGQHGQRRIEVRWKDGRLGLLSIGGVKGYLPFHASVVTDKSVTQFLADASLLYRALLESVMPYLSGKVDEPPVPFDELVEAELCALAARKSWTSGDREIAIADLADDDPGYDGAEFARGYKKMRYPDSKE